MWLYMTKHLSSNRLFFIQACIVSKCLIKAASMLEKLSLSPPVSPLRLTWSGSFLIILSPNMRFFPIHQAVLRETSWVSYNLTLFWHYLETASGPTSMPPAPSPSEASHKPTVSSELLTNQPQIGSSNDSLFGTD